MSCLRNVCHRDATCPLRHFFLGVMNPRSVNLRELNWLVCSEVGFPSESLAFEDGKYG